MAVAILLANPPPLHAASAPTHETLLDVPYVPQSGELCGGAAAAMVLRYWGARRVTPDEFKPLVVPQEHGIPTIALTSAIEARGWQALPMTGSPALVQHHLAEGRPLIAMLEVRPGQFHYVVIVAWTADRVLYHDPALLPFRSAEPAAFDRQWASASRWTLLILPPAGSRPPPPTRREAHVGTTAPVCADSLARGVELAQAGQLQSAAETLGRAHEECPNASAPLTELASVRLLQSDAGAAARLAKRATSLNRHDDHAWRVLATSRFLESRPDAALDAWNRAGDPMLDFIHIDGLTRTKDSVIERALGLDPGKVLTTSQLEHARRRLASVPAVATSRLQYAPAGEGLADVRAEVVESPVIPWRTLDLASLAVRATVEREATVTFSSLAHNGETITADWRWWDTRPRAAVEARIPLTGFLHGVFGLEGVVERQIYLLSTTPDSPSRLTEEHRGATASLGDWVFSWLHWEVSGGVDRWRSVGTLGRVGAALDMRAARDHIFVQVSSDLWPGAQGFDTVTTSVRWRSRTEGSGAALFVDADAALASNAAPRDLWPGADSGQARPWLLRAHPLLVHNAISSEAFGRQLAHVSGEWRSTAAHARILHVHAALFVDAAHAWRGDATRDRTLVDVGGGIRVGLPGQGTLRLDAARGVIDGGNALSAGWILPWPERR
jgi:hypothetical protein